MLQRVVRLLRGAGVRSMGGLVAIAPRQSCSFPNLNVPTCAQMEKPLSAAQRFVPQAFPLGSLVAAVALGASCYSSAICADDSTTGPSNSGCIGSPPVPAHYKVPSTLRKKYGRYLPWQRINVDQVPLPFVNDMDTTYNERGGEKRVTINQLGPSLSKRQATGQLCFRPMVPPPSNCTGPDAQRLYKKYLQEQPAPCIIFRGKGRISQAERDAYPDGLVVLWQEKAWVDRPTALEWAEKVIKPFIEAECNAGVASSSDRYLLFQDNLDAQKQPEYIRYLREECQTHDHKVPPNETDQVQPIDRGLGWHVKLYMGQEVRNSIVYMYAHVLHVRSLQYCKWLAHLTLRWMHGWTMRTTSRSGRTTA